MPGRPAPVAPVRIMIVGAGAMGTFFGARLAQAGHHVSVIARGERLSEIRRDGLRLESGGETSAVPVHAVDDPALVTHPDLAIIATKTTGLEAAIATLAQHASAALGVLTVQNGVEAPGLVAAGLPGAQVLAGRVHGFFEMSDGLVRHVGVPPSLAFEPISPSPTPAADLLATCLSDAAIGFTRPADIAVALWEKLMLVSSIGGLGAAVGLPIGAIRDSSEHRAVLRGLVDEVHTLGVVRGIPIPEDYTAKTMIFIDSFPAAAMSSLQRDLMARRLSEFDHLTGAIPRLAAPFGLPVPNHDAVIARLRAQGMV